MLGSGINANRKPQHGRESERVSAKVAAASHEVQRLVPGRSLDAVDDQNLGGDFGRLQFEPEVLESRSNGRPDGAIAVELESHIELARDAGFILDCSAYGAAEHIRKLRHGYPVRHEFSVGHSILHPGCYPASWGVAFLPRRELRPFSSQHVVRNLFRLRMNLELEAVRQQRAEHHLNFRGIALCEITQRICGSTRG